jgi:hypothetical protein
MLSMYKQYCEGAYRYTADERSLPERIFCTEFHFVRSLNSIYVPTIVDTVPHVQYSSAVHTTFRTQFTF